MIFRNLLLIAAFCGTSAHARHFLNLCLTTFGMESLEILDTTTSFLRPHVVNPRSGSSILSALVFEPLMPGLALSSVASNQNKTYVVTLKKNVFVVPTVKFKPLRALQSADVAFGIATLKTYMNSAYNNLDPDEKNTLNNIVEVKSPSPEQVVFVLKVGDPLFVKKISTQRFAVTSLEHWTFIRGLKHLSNQDRLAPGSGSWSSTAYIRDTLLVLDKLPQLNSAISRIYASAAYFEPIIVEKFKNKECDVVALDSEQRELANKLKALDPTNYVLESSGSEKSAIVLVGSQVRNLSMKNSSLDFSQASIDEIKNDL